MFFVYPGYKPLQNPSYKPRAYKRNFTVAMMPCSTHPRVQAKHVPQQLDIPFVLRVFLFLGNIKKAIKCVKILQVVNMLQDIKLHEML